MFSVTDINNFADLTVGKDNQIKEALKVLDSSCVQIIIIVDEKNRVLGTVTDGDVRRALLKGITLEEEVSKVMNLQPITIDQSMDDREIYEIFKLNGINHLPIVDSDKVLCGLKFLDTNQELKISNCSMVIMAGGRGVRLQPMTENCPKPLL